MTVQVGKEESQFSLLHHTLVETILADTEKSKVMEMLEVCSFAEGKFKVHYSEAPAKRVQCSNC